MHLLRQQRRARARFRKPQPGEQLYVEATFGGQPVAMISPVAHDPLWTLYPQRDGNWILWTPQGYFDCSPDAASVRSSCL